MSTKHKVLGTKKWKNKRLSVLQRDGYECYVCGGQADQVDHIIPRVKGGDVFDDDNLMAICGRCNRAKGSGSFRHTPTPPVFSSFLSPMRSEIAQDSPFTARPKPDQT
jgi:5-methylcytosine-specific restriction endonuclease McrA